MNQTPNKSRATLRWIEVSLWMAGAAALLYCGWTLGSAAITQAKMARALQQARRTPTKAAGPATPGLVGRLEIHRIGISAVVMEGVDNQTMAVAVGHVPGTPQPGQRGNAVLAAHRDTFFRPLRNIKANDQITVDTGSRVVRYRVTSTEIVDPHDVAVIQSHRKNELTLVTCYPFYYVGAAPKRFIVHAELVPAPAHARAARRQAQAHSATTSGRHGV